jgi:hypothetical protein
MKRFKRRVILILNPKARRSKTISRVLLGKEV